MASLTVTPSSPLIWDKINVPRYIYNQDNHYNVAADHNNERPAHFKIAQLKDQTPMTVHPPILIHNKWFTPWFLVSFQILDLMVIPRFTIKNTREKERNRASIKACTCREKCLLYSRKSPPETNTITPNVYPKSRAINPYNDSLYFEKLQPIRFVHTAVNFPVAY